MSYVIYDKTTNYYLSDLIPHENGGHVAAWVKDKERAKVFDRNFKAMAAIEALYLHLQIEEVEDKKPDFDSLKTLCEAMLKVIEGMK